MPYNLKDETPAKIAWMERCVKGVLSNKKFKSRVSGESRKVAAIKVCKSQIGKKKNNPVRGLNIMANAIRRAGIRK